MKKFAVLLLFIALFGGLILYRRHEMKSLSGGAGEAEPVTVETVTLRPAEFADVLHFTANIESEETAAVVSKVPGRTVLEVFVHEGDAVKKGDRLAVLDDSLLRQQILQAGAVLGKASVYASTAGAEYRRMAELYKEKVISRRQFEQAEGASKGADRQVQEAKAALGQLQIMMEYHTLKAPIDGIVLARNINPGDTSSQGAAFLLSRQENVKVSGSVPEKAYSSVQLGQDVTVEVDALPSRTFSGRVSRIFPFLDPAARTGKVEILLPSEGVLVPGMFARITLSTGSHEGLALPREALDTLPGTGETICYVVSGEKALLRTITTGAERENLVEVLSGVEPGEPVIAVRSEKIRDGSPVRISGK